MEHSSSPFLCLSGMLRDYFSIPFSNLLFIFLSSRLTDGHDQVIGFQLFFRELPIWLSLYLHDDTAFVYNGTRSPLVRKTPLPWGLFTGECQTAVNKSYLKLRCLLKYLYNNLSRLIYALKSLSGFQLYLLGN